ncbi:hypothetical protein [Streptomyces lavendulae]|uniref:hypothetical protein n=1 Tax=Streptomyces lavendulae TaxID=1914 RepID=UPI0024A4A4B2|nr:hypothetical protein [Streptomyces lavendulae]GLV99065.1 hypothetical protein Slala05_26970 [Streptomyces lavendulae subsp. lavendulae]
MSSTLLPPVAPEVLAEAVEGLTARLRKRLDAAVEACGAGAEAGPDGTVALRFGEDAVVTLSPGPSGTVTDPAQAVCTCLLAPRCLHRAAALGAAPLADPEPEPLPGADTESGSRPGPVAGTSPERGPGSHPEAGTNPLPGSETAAGTDPATGSHPAQGGLPEAGAGAGTRAATGGLPEADHGTGSHPATGILPEAAGAGPGAANGASRGAGAGAGPGADAGAPPEVGAESLPGGGAKGLAGSGAAARPAAGSRPLPGGRPQARPGGDAGGDAAVAVTAAQRAAGAGLWAVGAEALAAGVTAAGAVAQAELLRAAHTARLAGLPQAEAAALRVVRGLRAARERHAAQRLGDLAAAFRELLTSAAPLASGTGGPGLTGGARRAYTAGGSLRVYGLCREPVLSATGYGGVVTHLLGADGCAYSLSDVRPGGLARARGAGAASVALGGGVLDHAGLARAGLRIVGATVSADGRLGAGRGVRATPMPVTPWTAEPLAALFARPAAEAVAELLSRDEAEPGLLGCDVEVVGAAGEHLLVREARADAPLLRLRPAHPHPELAHTANLRRLAGYPGLAVRILGRPDPDRAATLSPLAVGPVPGAAYTLRLPPEWRDRADLGYDRLQGAHFPGEAPAATAEAVVPGPDPLADAPLWRVGRLLETGVAGGRRAVAETARGPQPLTAYGPLRRAGFGAAADLAAALVAEADRRPRDVFGRLTDASSDGYAWAWLAASTHLKAARRSLVTASWT